MAQVEWLRKNDFLFAADFAAGVRNPGRAKALGLEAGDPDLRIYMPNGHLLLAENKTTRGALSKAQKKRHARLAENGFPVHVIRARTPAEAVDKLKTIIEEHDAPNMDR